MTDIYQITNFNMHEHLMILSNVELKPLLCKCISEIVSLVLHFKLYWKGWIDVLYEKSRGGHFRYQ
jgi:hypothetical protein